MLTDKGDEEGIGCESEGSTSYIEEVLETDDDGMDLTEEEVLSDEEDDGVRQVQTLQTSVPPPSCMKTPTASIPLRQRPGADYSSTTTGIATATATGTDQTNPLQERPHSPSHSYLPTLPRQASAGIGKIGPVDEEDERPQQIQQDQPKQRLECIDSFDGDYSSSAAPSSADSAIAAVPSGNSPNHNAEQPKRQQQLILQQSRPPTTIGGLRRPNKKGPQQFSAKVKNDRDRRSKASSHDDDSFDDVAWNNQVTAEEQNTPSLYMTLKQYAQSAATKNMPETTAIHRMDPEIWARTKTAELNDMGITTTAALMRQVRGNPCLNLKQGVSESMIRSIQNYLAATTPTTTSLADNVKVVQGHEDDSKITSEPPLLPSPSSWNDEDRLVDILLIFAQTVLPAVRRSNIGYIQNDNHDDNSSAIAPSFDPQQWAQDFRNYCHANGWSTAMDLQIALRETSTIEALLAASTTTNQSASPTSSTSSSSLVLCQSTLAALHQFLYSWCGDIYNPKCFASQLLDFARIHHEVLSLQFQSITSSSPTATTTTTATSTESTTAATTNAATTCADWVRVHVDQLQRAGITTTMELVTSIQRNQLEGKLDDVMAMEPIDRITQQQLERYFQPLLPLTSPPSSGASMARLIHHPTSIRSMMARACPEQAHLILHHNKATKATGATGPNGIHKQPSNQVSSRFGYNYEERRRVRARPLESRLFLSNVRTPRNGWNDDDQEDEETLQGWLRTRFSDQAIHGMELQKYCYLIWQAQQQVQQERTRSKREAGGNGVGFAAVDATFSSILSGFFLMEHNSAIESNAYSSSLGYMSSHSYSEVCTLASALSCSGDTHNIHFGLDPTDAESTMSDQTEFRLLFAMMMKIIFQTLTKHKFLCRNFNTYRLAHCLTDGSLSKFPLWMPCLSFFVQCILIGYVVWELVEDVILVVWPSYPTINMYMLGLGVVTSLYSLLQVRRGVRAIRALRELYQYDCGAGCTASLGLLAFIDVFVHLVLPIIVAATGFVIISVQDSFVHAILIASALLFLPQIDEQLPRILRIEPRSIIETYLTRKAVDELHVALTQFGDTSNSFLQRRIKARYAGENINFSDILVTNSSSEGSNLRFKRYFGPYEVQASGGRHEERIHVASNKITKDCLLKEVKWRYRRDLHFDKGHLDRLLLVRLDGRTVELTHNDMAEDRFLCGNPSDDGSHDNSSLVTGLLTDPSATRDKKVIPVDYGRPEWDGEAKGIFIVTMFEVKQSVSNLRICGSSVENLGRKELARAKRQFKRAVKYYSLWDVDSSAEWAL